MTLGGEAGRYTGFVAASILMSHRLSTQVLDNVEALEGLAPEWRRIWLKDEAATPFQHPDWLIPWTRHLWGGGKLRVLAISEKELLSAIAPFFLWGFGSGKVRLSLLGSGISDYSDVTHTGLFPAELRENIHRWMATNSDWCLCDLQDVPPGSPLFEETPNAQPVACPVLPLENTMEAQFARADSKLRRSVRTAEKRLRDAGSVEFVRADGDNCEALLERLFTLHAGRWHERGESGMFSSGALRKFHAEVVRRFSDAGLLRLYGLLLDGECIAVQYNFAAKGRVYAYQAGFDPAWSRSSPGSVVLAHSIEEAIREGAREFDFLRHAQDFKYAWGARDTFVYHLVIPRRAV